MDICLAYEDTWTIKNDKLSIMLRYNVRRSIEQHRDFHVQEKLRKTMSAVFVWKYSISCYTLKIWASPCVNWLDKSL